MKIIETTFEKLPTKCLLIGFEGENLRATVRIDCASVFAEYPNATPALIVKPLFADAYPVVVDRNGTDVDWLITSEILSFNGDGEIQLVFYKDQVICKSAVSKIRVSRSLQVTGEKPDPIARWEDAANQKLAEVDAALVSIDEMDATAHGLPEGSAPTAEVQDVDDHKRIVLGIPAGATGATGAKGDKGDRGEVGATPQVGIGTVQTLPAGSSATASMSGTTENPLLNLGIPQGIQGVKGDRGEKGETGATGATGATPDLSIGTVTTLPAGSSATAEITGTADNPVLSLGIPQGAQGIQGEKGEKGDPGDGTPTGGLKGQVLAKASDTDRATEWINVAPVIKNTASGAIASFPDGADGHPVDELKVSIEPVQDLHGYDNPWPAGGGKNKFDKNAVSSGSYNSASGAFNNYGIHSDYIKVTPGQQISQNKVKTTTVTDGEQTFFSSWTYWDSNKQFVSGVWNASNTVTIPDDVAYLIVSTSRSIGNSSGQFTQSTVDEFLADYIIADGATIPTFAPYSNICPIAGWDGVQIVVSPTTDAEDGQTYDITLPSEAGTVYGGELTVNADGSGSLVVDRASVDLGTLNLRTNSTEAKIYQCNPPNMKRVVEPPYENRQTGAICSIYPASKNFAISVSMDDKSWLKSGNQFFVRDTSYDNASSFIAAMSGVQLVYELAEPITYTLTPTEIRTLLGTNNVWSDAGDVSVKYNADTKLYIDNKITQAIAAALNA